MYLHLRVLGTTSWTGYLQTGSQEVRGFESLRLHRECPGQSCAIHPSFTCQDALRAFLRACQVLVLTSAWSWSQDVLPVGGRAAAMKFASADCGR